MLTDVQVHNAKPTDKPYKLTDGGGLYIYVPPAGGRLWRYRYAFEGREQLLSIGTYPALLSEARAAREAAKADLRKGDNPGLVKKQRRAIKAQQSAETFQVKARNGTNLRSRRGHPTVRPTCWTAWSGTCSRIWAISRSARSPRPMC